MNTAPSTRYCRPWGRELSTNCGRKAAKNSSVFGFDSATVRLRTKATRPRRASAGDAASADRMSGEGLRHSLTPSQTR